MKKVGIMGGTFNPIHYGHLFLAENSYEQLSLNQVLFMPSKNPPHKDKPREVTEHQREEMISLAIKDNSHFELSTMELDREGTTYTADTLTILTGIHPDTEYFFLLGADSLFQILNWKDPQTIFNLCTIVVANRDNMDVNKLMKQADYLRDTFKARIILIDMPTIQISSETIRGRIGAHKSVRYFLPDAVNEYVISNNLYVIQPEDLR